MAKIRVLVAAILCCFIAAIAKEGTDKSTEKIIPKPAAGEAPWHLNAKPTKTKTPVLKSLGTQLPRAIQPTNLAANVTYPSTCSVYVNEPMYAFYDWLVGDEIYYAYQDVFFPNFKCDTLYPFVVTHIGMTLALNDTGTIALQVFLTDLDPIYSSPVCPLPYQLLYISEAYNVYIPAPDVYTIMITLEKPVPVNGPYFACIYFGNDISAMYPGIAIDSTPYLCINYNDWGQGLVDLAQNDYYNFPGSIHLFSVGYSKAGTLPKPHFIVPGDSGVVLAGNVLWIAELNDTFTYQSARFDYFKSGQWFTIGSDFDGTVPLRDGVSAGNNDNGWSVIWQPQGLPEGNYLIKASIADFDSTFVTDTATVYLDLKKLEPTFAGRTDLMTTCGAETVQVTIQDENPTAVTFGYRPLPNYEDRNLPLLKRNDYGDANGNPSDGNHNFNGEFGEYYVAPAVFASMMKYWYDKGYVELFTDGPNMMTLTQTVEKLASTFHTRADKGTEDDDLVYGVTNYLRSRVGRIVPEVMRRPSWEWFKANYLGRIATVAFAIHAPFSNWLAVQKVDYQNANADSFPVTYYDPVGGLLRDSYLLVRGDSLLLGYLPNNKAYSVDLGVALHTKLENISYITFGTDFDPINGWKGVLPQSQFQQGLRYLIRARALDANNQIGDSYWITKYDCTGRLTQGDADNSGTINIGDAIYLINFIFAHGPAPIPNRAHGDANCDGSTNISDAVFLIQYLFASGAPPCR